MDVPNAAWGGPAAAPGSPAAPNDPDQAGASYRGDTSAHVITGVFILFLAYMAYEGIRGAIQGVQAVLDPNGPEAQAIKDNAQFIDGTLLWFNSAIILFAFGIIPLGWVAATRVRAAATWVYLRMNGDRRHIGREFGLGLGTGILLWLGVIILSAIILFATGGFEDALSNNTTNSSQESAITNALISNLTWPLAFFIAAVAGFAEEVFFRGVLQRWIGVWGQGILFGLTHAGYGTAAQIIVPFALGIGFGFMVKRGRSLWFVIGAHFMYDFVQLALALTIDIG